MLRACRRLPTADAGKVALLAGPRYCWAVRFWPKALLVGAATVAGTGLAYQRAHRDLGPPLERAIARALGIDPRLVKVGSAHVDGWSTLVLNQLAIGRASAPRVELSVDMLNALRGRLRLEHLVAVRPSLDGVARAERLEATLGRRGWRALVRRLELLGLPATVQLGELAVELDQGSVKRSAFREASAAGFEDVAGTVTRNPDGSHGWRIGCPGLDAGGTLRDGRLQARLRFEHLPLAALAGAVRAAGLELGQARASGEVDLMRDDSSLEVAGRLALDGLDLEQPALAAARAGRFGAVLDGQVRWRGGELELEALRITLDPVRIRLRGGVRLAAGRIEAADLDAALERMGCDELARALPPKLLPVIDGMVVDGVLAARAHVAGDLRRLDRLELKVDVDAGCRVIKDPPLADATKLRGPVVAQVVDAHGGPRRFPLGAENPSFRPLSALPARVWREFVIAEDGRFFAHHGFDLERIRHALAVDLGAARFDRGASTITQQLAKNLFLSGERTLARKLEEAVLAWRMEQVLSKRRILELYLNLVELGAGIHGVAEGARHYFGKPPAALTTDDAAALAALLPAPRRGMDAAWKRRYQTIRWRSQEQRRELERGENPRQLTLR